ncbi:Proton-coupled folate transporter, partial [Lamellibrachia satsuma]
VFVSCRRECSRSFTSSPTTPSSCQTARLSTPSHHNGNHRSESLCDVNKSDPVFVFGEEVQRRATNFSLILGLCSLIPALFVTMFIGAYSDKAGRRYAIIPPIAGCTCALSLLRNPEAKLFSTKHIKNTMLLFTKDDDTRRRWKLCVLLCAVFVCGVAKMGYCVDTLFEMNSPLCWTSDIIGYFLSAKVAVVGAGAVLSMRLLKCCMQDGGIALTSCLMGVVRSAYTAFVQNSAMMYITPLMSIFDFLFFPTVRALMSSLVHDHQQGALYGGIAFIEVICSLVGDVLFNSVYSATLYIMTGFVYLVMAAFYAVSCLLLVVFIVKMGRENRIYMKFDDDDAAGERGTSLPSLHIE